MAPVALPRARRRIRARQSSPCLVRVFPPLFPFRLSCSGMSCTAGVVLAVLCYCCPRGIARADTVVAFRTFWASDCTLTAHLCGGGDLFQAAVRTPLTHFVLPTRTPLSSFFLFIPHPGTLSSGSGGLGSGPRPWGPPRPAGQAPVTAAAIVAGGASVTQPKEPPPAPTQSMRSVSLTREVINSLRPSYSSAGSASADHKS